MAGLGETHSTPDLMVRLDFYRHGPAIHIDLLFLRHLQERTIPSVDLPPRHTTSPAPRHWRFPRFPLWDEISIGCAHSLCQWPSLSMDWYVTLAAPIVTTL